MKTNINKAQDYSLCCFIGLSRIIMWWRGATGWDKSLYFPKSVTFIHKQVLILLHEKHIIWIFFWNSGLHLFFVLSFLLYSWIQSLKDQMFVVLNVVAGQFYQLVKLLLSVGKAVYAIRGENAGNVHVALRHLSWTALHTWQIRKGRWWGVDVVPHPTFQMGHNVSPHYPDTRISLPWQLQQGRERTALDHPSHPDTAKGQPGGRRTTSSPLLTRLSVFSKGVIHQREEHHCRRLWGLCIFEDIALL